MAAAGHTGRVTRGARKRGVPLASTSSTSVGFVFQQKDDFLTRVLRQEEEMAKRAKHERLRAECRVVRDENRREQAKKRRVQRETARCAPACLPTHRAAVTTRCASALQR